MAILADAKRRIGIGVGGLLLWAVLSGAGIGYALLAGDVRETIANEAPIEVAVPGVLFGLAVFGVAIGVSNAPGYLRLALYRQTSTGVVAGGTGSGRVLSSGGVDTADAPLVTPFDGIQAVAYTTRVLQNTVDDAETVLENGQNWRVVHVDGDATSFTLDDGTGPVRVEPNDPRLRLEGRSETIMLGDEGLPADLDAYLEEKGVDVDRDEHLRFDETTLQPGQTAVVAGRVDGTAIDAWLVGEGHYVDRLRRRVVTIGGGSLVVALGSFAVLLWTANVV